MMTDMPPIEIVAALIRDSDGKALLVRKRGTRAFMQPGGKRDPGESDLAALAREIREELTCEVLTDSVRRLGEFVCPAANEPGRDVKATVYAVNVTGDIRPAAEIDEIVWVDPAHPGPRPLAPLTRDHVLPLAMR
jgi:8-oxo-dGTP diphosphatase